MRMRRRKPPHFAIWDSMTALHQDPLLQKAEDLAAEGHRAEAIACLRAAMGTGPEGYRRRLLLGRLLFEKGEYAAAGQMTRSAEPLDPLRDDFAKIGELVTARQGHLVEPQARAMLAKIPGHPRAIFAIAQIIRSSGDHEARVAILREGLAACPANSILRQLLVGALEDAGQFSLSVREARLLPKVEEGFSSFLTLASVLFKYGQYQEALDATQRAGAFVQDQREAMGEVLLLEGQILRVLGRRDKAVEALRQSTEQRRFAGAPLWALADMKTVTFSEAERNIMERSAAHPQTPPEERSMAAFSLAKALELDEDWEHAMPTYHQANRLHPEKSFSPRSFHSALSGLTERLSEQALARTANEYDAATPIFIVGLPRSGSTLIEQILASHSQIEGTIETMALPAIKRRAHLFIREQTKKDYADGLGELSEADLSALGDAYLEETKVFRSSQVRFYTDKLPHNFEHVGLIAKILPHAVIIDARRNPLDCGLSIYKQYFAKGSSFAYDLGHIGAYYRGYLTLMDHWDHVLPGKVLRVQHEDLVRHPEMGIARILRHIGVTEEKACFAPHETLRAVRTASAEQVRQPISAQGIGTWKKAGAHLKPLRDALSDEVLTRFNGLYE